MSRCTGEKHLPTMTGAHDPRRTVHVDADIALVREQRLARVQAHPHPNRSRLERVARLGRRGQGVRRLGEGDEERVALGVHLDATVTLESVAQDTTVLGQRPRVIILKLLQQTSRALDVREKERDVARRKVTHTLEDYASARICQGSGGADQKAGPS